MEQWIRWEPIQGLEGKYYLDDFSWSKKGFIVELIHEKKDEKIQILFDNYIDAFRYTNESFYLTILDNASPKHETRFYANFSFYKITNSEYLVWLSKQSAEWSDLFNFTHFCILGGDEVIDIVTNYEPKVTIMDYEPKTLIAEKVEDRL